MLESMGLGRPQENYNHPECGDQCSGEGTEHASYQDVQHKHFGALHNGGLRRCYTSLRSLKGLKHRYFTNDAPVSQTGCFGR